MMEKCLAFVMSGGGARGALQVGALRALLEAGYKPDLLVGTSIGAANAAGLALWGINMEGIAALERTYQAMAEGNVMDTPGQLAWHALSGRPTYTSQRMKDLLIDLGIGPELTFGHVKNVRVGLVSADMASGKLVIYGLEPTQSILEGVLASASVPPWFMPIENDDQLIVDGGALSLLPVEPALNMGATEVIALDLSGSPSMISSSYRINRMNKAVSAFIKRETNLEFALAEAKGVQVHYMQLLASPPIKMWDFSSYQRLLETGYEIAHRHLSDWAQNRNLENEHAGLFLSSASQTGELSDVNING
jgi:NTE family protein